MAAPLVCPVDCPQAPQVAAVFTSRVAKGQGLVQEAQDDEAVFTWLQLPLAAVELLLENLIAGLQHWGFKTK